MKKSVLGHSFKELINRYDSMAVMFGVIMGVVFVNPIYDDFHAQWGKYSIAFWGQNAQNIFYIINPVFSAAIAFVLARTVHAVLSNHAERQSLEPDEKPEFTVRYFLPDWPAFAGNRLSLVVGEKHHPDGTYKLDPTWSIIPERGLFGNIAVFGGIGSGKTASVAYPLLRQFFEFKPDDVDLKMGGLVLDQKGDFNARVLEFAKEYGRSEDCIVLGPDHDYAWNPIHQPDIDPETLAARVIAVYENVTADEGGGDNAWIGLGARKLIAHSLGALRIIHDYCTLEDINKLVVVGNPEQVLLRMASEQGTDQDNEYFQYHLKFFSDEWAQFNERSKGIILSAVSNVCGLFSRPDIAKIFCPPKDKISLPQFDDLIDSGKIIALDMPESRYGVIGVGVGILLKLEFQQAALRRVSRAKNDPSVNTKRNLFFICDEYQNFVTAGGLSGGGDNDFYALARQSRCISMVLTQAPASLIEKIGEEKAQVVFLNIRTKLFLTLTDSQGAEFAADFCGKSWQGVETRTTNETVNNAVWNPVSNEQNGDNASVSVSTAEQDQYIHTIAPDRFMKLRAFEAIISTFDGIKQREPEVSYLKTDFIPEVLASDYQSPRRIPHYELQEAIKE